MHRFLHFPFETPDLVTFSPCLDITPEAPILTLFSLLTDAIDDDGLKTTATGNLPRNFCREVARAFWGKGVCKILSLEDSVYRYYYLRK